MGLLGEIINALFLLYLLTFVARFMLQWTRMGFHNQLSQLVIAVTNPLVRPARRIIPGIRGIDLATLVVAFAVAAVNGVVLTLVVVQTLPAGPGLAVYVPLRILDVTADLFIFCILISVLVSWIAPYQQNPMVTPLRNIAEIMLRPVRRVIPPISGFDISPVFVLIILFASARYISVYSLKYLFPA